ncbi:hypothetical protein RI196_02330 [Aeribacillus composti]|uniref:YfzA-like protein n=1 Tax=Aeribacillus composti TaxID=1868734 RepID=A0ABY9WBQ5_9BACI|nr:hypothetical protein [Aeribacillus composti]WNF33551.1 hypothetical protein RI196_02330 [Aeribacillus composti]
MKKIVALTIFIFVSITCLSLSSDRSIHNISAVHEISTIDHFADNFVPIDGSDIAKDSWFDVASYIFIALSLTYFCYRYVQSVKRRIMLNPVFYESNYVVSPF